MDCQTIVDHLIKLNGRERRRSTNLTAIPVPGLRKNVLGYETLKIFKFH